jgi:hypothetical protein
MTVRYTPCFSDPERWQPQLGKTKDDEQARQQCITCFMRLQCANSALDQLEDRLPVAGIWAGVYIPCETNTSDTGKRARRIAISQLRVQTGRKRSVKTVK